MTLRMTGLAIQAQMKRIKNLRLENPFPMIIMEMIIINRISSQSKVTMRIKLKSRFHSEDPLELLESPPNQSKRNLANESLIQPIQLLVNNLALKKATYPPSFILLRKIKRTQKYKILNQLNKNPKKNLLVTMKKIIILFDQLFQICLNHNPHK